MKKRGQVTLFLVLGAILLILAVAFISLKTSMTTQQAKVEEEKVQQTALVGESIKIYVESCIERTAREAILENSLSGGYFTLPEKSTTDLFNNVPYYSQNELDLFPPDETIATEIANYVDELVDLCLNEFKPFQEQGYEIVTEKPMSKASLSAQKITVRTTFPIMITVGETTAKISNFEVEFSATEFYQNILTSREIVKNQNEKICLTCFSNLAAENDLFVNILPTIENTYIIDITDENYLINGEKYHLRFAIQYNEILE